MRFIPTLFHAILDYLVGLVLIALPLVFGLEGTAFLAPMALGIFVLMYSVCTDYELGLVRFLRVRFHLVLDVVIGIVALLTATIIDFPPVIRWVIYAIGMLAIVLPTFTKVRATGTAP